MTYTAKTHAEAEQIIKTQIAPGMTLVAGSGYDIDRPHVLVIYRAFEARVTVKPSGDTRDNDWTCYFIEINRGA
jgi:hypothetical protein